MASNKENIIKYDLPYDIKRYRYIKDGDKHYVLDKNGSYGREISELDYLKYLHNIGDSIISIKNKSTQNNIYPSKSINTIDEISYSEDINTDDAPDAIFYANGGVVESGIIKGAGTGKSDSIISQFPSGSIIVPVEKVKEAKKIYKKYIKKDIPEVDHFNGGSFIKTSNGEFVFSPEDAEYIQKSGGDLTSILPDNYIKAADGAVVDDYDFSDIINNESKSSLNDFDYDFSDIVTNDKKDSLKKKQNSQVSFTGSPITQKASPYQPPQLISQSDSSTLKSENIPSESEKFEFKFNQPSKVKLPKTITTTTSGEGTLDIEPSKDKTYSQEIIDAIGVGSARIGSSIARTPSLIYNIASIPQNLIAKYTGIPIETSAEEFGKTIGIEDNQIAKYYEDIINKTKEGINEKYNKGITDYLFGDNPDYEKGFKLLGLQIAESAPMSMSLAIGNAAGLNPIQTTLGGGAIFAAEKMKELDDSGADLSEYEKIGIATSSGLLEGLFENVGITKLGNLTKNIILKEGAEKAKDIAKKGFIDTYLPVAKKYIGIGAEESISEAATQFSQNAVDKYTGYKPDIDLMDGVYDAALVGGFAGSGFAFAPASIDLYNTSKIRKEASDLISKKDAIENEILNPDLAPQTKQELSDASLNINEKLSDLYKEDKKILSEIPQDNVIQIIEFNEKLNNINNALTDISLTEESKSILEENKKNIESKIEELETIKPKEDAIQEQETASVLQRKPQETREARSERGGMEQEQQGQEIASKSKEEKIIESTSEKTDINEQEIQPQFSSPEEATRYVIENSTDPIEIINTYNRENPESKLSYKQQIIKDADIKINRNSYKRFGDVNKISMNLAKQFFTSKNNSSNNIDAIASQLSQDSGIEITPQDIVDYIDSAKYERKISDTQRDLASRFTEITGLPFSNKSINKVLKDFERDENIKLEEYLNKEANDYESAKQQYAEAIRRGEIPIPDNEQISTNTSYSRISEGEVDNNEQQKRQEEDLRADVLSKLNSNIKDLDKMLSEKSINLPNTSINNQSSNIVNVTLNPFKYILKSTFGAANKVQEKSFGRIVDISKDWVSKQIKKGIINQNNIKRQSSQLLSAYNNGLPRTKEDLKQKRLLTGSINLSKVKADEFIKNIHSLLGNSVESLEKIHFLLDPDFYGKQNPLFDDNLKYDDLSDNEKYVYNLLRKQNDIIHDWNFSMGLIPMDTYLKFKDKYIARSYDPFESTDNIDNIVDNRGYNINDKNIKIFEGYTKARGEVDEWKKENILKDPVYSTAKRMMQTEANASVLAYIDYISKQKGLVSKEPRKGFSLLSGNAYGKLNGVYVPNYIAEDFKGYFFANKIIDLLYDVSKLYDKNQIRQFIKKYHTVYSPSVQLGNASSNYIFAFLSGIDPITFGNYYRGAGLINNLTPNKIEQKIGDITESPAYKEFKQKGSIYQLLVKNGILGTDVLTSDLKPISSQANERAKLINKSKKTLLDGVSNIDKKITNMYSNSDDLAKISAFMSLKEYGYSDEKAIDLVYDGFQNYATIGKLWDFASKFPVYGSAFIKFQADLQRIVLNAAVKRPLSSAAFVALIRVISDLASKSSGESEDKKEIRERRPYTPYIPKWFYGGAPLTIKTDVGEINAARFMSPFYSYEKSDNDYLDKYTKYLPFQLKLVEDINKDSKRVFFPKQDPFLGVWVSAIIDDKDFRGKSIQDPESTKYRNSSISSTDKTLNAANYILRSQLPLYSTAYDLISSINYGEDYYGRIKSPARILIDKFVKSEEINKSFYKNILDKEINSIDREISKLEAMSKDTYSIMKKEIKKIDNLLEDGSINQKQYDNRYDYLIKKRDERNASILDKIAIQQEKLNKINEKYEYILLEYLD